MPMTFYNINLAAFVCFHAIPVSAKKSLVLIFLKEKLVFIHLTKREIINVYAVFLLPKINSLKNA